MVDKAEFLLKRQAARSQLRPLYRFYVFKAGNQFVRVYAKHIGEAEEMMVDLGFRQFSKGSCYPVYMAWLGDYIKDFPWSYGDYTSRCHQNFRRSDKLRDMYGALIRKPFNEN